MFSRAVSRSGTLTLSTAWRTQLGSRSLSVLRLAKPPVVLAAPTCAKRSFSFAPILRADNMLNEDQPGPSATVFLGNLPFSVTGEQIKEAFSQFGTIVAVKLLTTQTGIPRGAGFLQFASVEEATGFLNAHNEDPIFITDRQIFLQYAKKDSTIIRPPADPSDTLLIGPFHGEESDAWAFFKDFDKDIREVRLVKRQTDGQTLAFIQFNNVELSMAALEALDRQRDSTGRQIFLRYAKPRQSPKQVGPLFARKSQRTERDF
ncbi:hypothetical protein HYDPIDRAFT_116265 [Hydnomerulius pinastri MD-312]|uniref:RRM domain-containing protein n=1 Tax=Hydnomerulius pinastri MD-312 TaxID=994086 RepID=A0A0C9V6M3_9AGAM|nr:hypothetical protein HYDPIDRAFT_116265 [Hydnomerulius pinastri MD-312]